MPRLLLGFPTHWRCGCGSYLRLEAGGMFSPAEAARRPAGVWRYREALGLPDSAAPVTLGEGATPLVRSEVAGREVVEVGFPP